MFSSYVQFTTAAYLFLLMVLTVWKWRGQRSYGPAFFLFGFLFFKFIAMLDYMLSRSFNAWVLEHIPMLDVVLMPALYLYMPAYFLFVLASCDRAFQWSRWHFIHVLPALIVGVYLLLKLLLTPYESLPFLLESKAFFSSFEMFMMFDVRKIIVFSYLTASMLTLLKFRAKIKGEYSDAAYKSLNWLFIVTCLLFAIFLWPSVVKLVGNLVEISELGREFSRAGQSLLLFILATSLFWGEEKHSALTFNTSDKSTTDSVDLKQSQKDWKKIDAQICRDQLYLKMGLTIEGLASELRLPARYLSELLNKHSNSNFFGYINALRIEEARRRLTSHNDHPVLQIAFDCGFSSKSTFNAVFKDMVGETPTSFRKNRDVQ